MNFKLKESNDFTVVGPTKFIRLTDFKRFKVYISFSHINYHHFYKNKKFISACTRIGIRINFYKRGFACYTEQIDDVYEVTEEYSLAN